MFDYKKFDENLKALSKLDRIKLIAENYQEMGRSGIEKVGDYLNLAKEYYSDYLNYNSSPGKEDKNAISLCYCGFIQLMIYTPGKVDIKNVEEIRKFVYLNGEKQCQAEMEYLLCVLYLTIGENSKSAESGLKVLELLGDTTLPPRMKFLYSNLGLSLERCNKLEEAEQILLMGISANNKIDLAVESKLYLHLGNLYNKQKRVDKALDAYRKSEKYTVEKDYSGKVVINANIGMIYYNMKDYKKASRQFELNANMGKWKLLDKFGQVSWANSLSYLILINLYESNIEGMDKYLKILKKFNSHYKDAQSTMVYYQRFANFSQLKGDHEEAVKSYFKALNFIKGNGSRDQIYYVTNEVAEFLLTLGRNEEAEKLLLENIERFKDGVMYVLMLNTYKTYLGFLKSSERYKEALEIAEQIKAIEKKMHNSQLEEKVNSLEREIANEKQKIQERDRRINLINRRLHESIEDEFIGVSQKIKDVLQKVQLAAEHPDINVLILGESGTGKQIIADLIHRNSNRKAGSFCEVNCSAIPETMFESEFFGYKKGAFTGAQRDNSGFLAEANNGTLFLDEIGDMPYALQSKLLKVLESKNFTPLGSNKPEKTDFRLICATHQNLEELVKSRLFRLDLHNRINTFIITIPPLRERQADIPVLADYYLRKYCEKMAIIKPDLDEKAMEMLKTYSYPGNVRELRNIIERTVLFLRTGMNLTSALKSSGLSIVYEPVSNEKAGEDYLLTFTTLNLEKIEFAAVKKALELSGNRKSKAADLLGITPSAMTRRLQKFKLD
ncbi:MAG: sigma 54-interacting transcriptional regulator [Candidatus Cloacimonetes bacterium]|nr:sigma 54-interacting transcriptional regulator [Candidatus Cloacimonadota bacterium]